METSGLVLKFWFFRESFGCPYRQHKNEISTEKASFKVTTLRKVEFNPDFSNIEEFKKHINDYVIKFEAQSGSYKDTRVKCTRKAE